MKLSQADRRLSPEEGGYVIHGEEGFEGMRRAGRLAGRDIRHTGRACAGNSVSPVRSVFCTNQISLFMAPSVSA